MSGARHSGGRHSGARHSGARQRLARACHLPWPLHQAEARGVDDGLVTAAGLPPPQGQPLVLYSPGVDVRIGRPEPLE
jgi:hypothetical protein